MSKTTRFFSGQEVGGGRAVSGGYTPSLTGQNAENRRPPEVALNWRFVKVVWPAQRVRGRLAEGFSWHGGYSANTPALTLHSHSTFSGGQSFDLGFSEMGDLFPATEAAVSDAAFAIVFG